MAEYTIEQFEQKLRNFSKRDKIAVKRALVTGSRNLRDEMRRRYLSRLHKRTGRLYKGIKVLGVSVSGTRIYAKAGVEPKQVYKGSVQEVGQTVQHPGGTPYMVVMGKARFLKKGSEGPWVRYTRPHSITIPARPFVGPSRQSELPKIRRNILNELMMEYKRA